MNNKMIKLDYSDEKKTCVHEKYEDAVFFYLSIVSGRTDKV